MGFFRRGIKKKTEVKYAGNNTGVEVINYKLQKKITEFIHERNLIVPGHFLMNEMFCGEGWIDVRSIVSNRELAAIMGELMINDIKTLLDSLETTVTETIIVGIGMNGNILAAKIGFALNLPFTYVLSQKGKQQATDSEKRAELDKYKNVILITGVVSTFDTISKICSQHGLEEKILRIYTVLYRHINTLKMTSQIQNIKKLMISFCNDFESNIIDRNNCMKTKYNNCVAKNLEW